MTTFLVVLVLLAALGGAAEGVWNRYRDRLESERLEPALIAEAVKNQDG